MLSENHFIALNAIYLKKMATSAAVAEAAGLPAAAVAETFAAAAEAGWIIDMPDGAMLLPEGTQQVLDHYRDAYAPIRGEPGLAAWYGNFETLNSRFVAAVTDWQKSDGDDKAERRVMQCAERLAKDIGALVARIPRYAAYPQRLERSMDKVDAGQRDFICKPTLDSVHNIWFEFHEDILAVLGRPRDTT